jgi:hypothetical protein
MYECRCDERLKTKYVKSTRLSYTGLLGELEHPTTETRLIDEMFSECDGWVCVLEVIGVPSILSVIRKTSVLTRVLPTFAFRVDENRERRKWNSPMTGIWTHGHGKESLPETSRPGFISTVRPDLSQPTHKTSSQTLKFLFFETVFCPQFVNPPKPTVHFPVCWIVW